MRAHALSTPRQRVDHRRQRAGDPFQRVGIFDRHLACGFCQALAFVAVGQQSRDGLDQAGLVLIYAADFAQMPTAFRLSQEDRLIGSQKPAHLCLR